MKAAATVLPVLAVLSVLAVLAAIACDNGKDGPTPNIDATVEAAVRGTAEAESAVSATVEAGIRATTVAEAAIESDVEVREVEGLAPTETSTPAATATPIPVPSTVPDPTPAPTPEPTPRPSPTATPAPTPAATPAPTPTPPPTPTPTLTPEQESQQRLELYAARYAGGPGAIYVGDPAQLAGPAVTTEYAGEYGRELGDDTGMVPLGDISDHRWIFESEYYRSLLEKARLGNPTELVSQGERINLLYSCVDDAAPSCRHLEIYFAENVTRRTDGQVTIQVSSHARLGIAPVGSAVLMEDGTLDMTEIDGRYVGEELPIFVPQHLWGLWPDDQTHFEIIGAILPEVARYIDEELGAKVLSLNWKPDDLFVYSKRRLDTLKDFSGLKTSVRSREMSDWVQGLGGQPLYLSPAEVHTALDRDIIDAVVASPGTVLNQRWHEVTSYMQGPLPSFNASFNAINAEVWNSIPVDLQQILVEESARHELEALRLAAVQDTTGLQRSVDAGLEYVEFSPELRQQRIWAGADSVLPQWLRRAGYPERGHRAVEVFNTKVGPIVGISIEPDGSVSGPPLAGGAGTGEGPEEPSPLPAWPLPEERQRLASYAAQNAGGPGAIFLGDLRQLAGPAPTPDLGDSNGNVPLFALEEDLFVFESPYYRSVVERARLTDATPLTSNLGAPVVIEHACLHPSLPMCRLFETYFAPNVERRTGGQLKIIPSSYLELGFATADEVGLLRDGTLSMATVFNPPAVPSLEILGLQGIYGDREELFNGTVRVLPHVEWLLANVTGGHPLIVNWDNGADLFVFSRKPLDRPSDMHGMAIRSLSRSLSDWINGMGAEATYLTLAETLSALERGTFDAAVTAADAAHAQEWYRATEYMNGPLTHWPAMYSVVNGDIWASLPRDLQEILREEAAKLELEALRLAAIQSLNGLHLNLDEGMTHVEFSPEMRAHSRAAAKTHVLPEWTARVGGPNAFIIEVFNRTISPVVGLTIEPDGTVSDSR